MIEFLISNIATIVVGTVLAAMVLLIIFQMKKDKKQGKSSCGCKCGGCPNAQLCHCASVKPESTADV